MNSKHLANAILVACVIAGAAWWWPVTPGPKKTPVAHSAPPPAQEAEMPSAALPPEPAEPLPAPVVAVEAPPAPPAGYDPQSELVTAIPDFIRLAQTGDWATLMQTYMSPDEQARIPEEQRAAMGQMMQTQMQSPQGQQRMQIMIAEMQAVQNTAPTLDETGNRATYTLPAGSSTQSVVFVKVNGRWYRK